MKCSAAAQYSTSIPLLHLAADLKQIRSITSRYQLCVNGRLLHKPFDAGNYNNKIEMTIIMTLHETAHIQRRRNHKVEETEKEYYAPLSSLSTCIRSERLGISDTVMSSSLEVLLITQPSVQFDTLLKHGSHVKAKH